MLYKHPITETQIEGVRLGAGAVLKKEDRYDSTNGNWETCPCVGVTLLTSGPHVIWVRITPFSQEAIELLKYLILHPWKFFRRYGDGWYSVPAIDTKMDPRVCWQKAEHPECLEELASYGFLDYFEEHAAYALTDFGLEEGKKIIEEKARQG